VAGAYSGRASRVVWPAPWGDCRVIVIAELRAWRLRQSEELLRLGVRLTDDTFICAREDGSPIQPNSIGHAWDRFLASPAPHSVP